MACGNCGSRGGPIITCPRCEGGGGFVLKVPPEKIKRGSKKLMESVDEEGLITVGGLTCGLCKGYGVVFRTSTNQLMSLDHMPKSDRQLPERKFEDGNTKE